MLQDPENTDGIGNGCCSNGGGGGGGGSDGVGDLLPLDTTPRIGFCALARALKTFVLLTQLILTLRKL